MTKPSATRYRTTNWSSYRAIEVPLMVWMAPAPGVAMRHYGVVV